MSGEGDGLEIVGAEVGRPNFFSDAAEAQIDLLKTIHEGRSGKVMPLWKWRLPEQQAKDVLAYVRTLRK